MAHLKYHPIPSVGESFYSVFHCTNTHSHSGGYIKAPLPHHNPSFHHYHLTVNTFLCFCSLSFIPITMSSETIVLKVTMSCEGCSGAVTRVLEKMEGVESFNIDMKEQKVTVKGNVKPEEVYVTVSKTGKKTAFWVEPEENKPSEAALAEPQNKPSEAALAEPQNKPSDDATIASAAELDDNKKPSEKTATVVSAAAEPDENKPSQTVTHVA